MLTALVVTVATVLQAANNPPVRVSRADSTAVVTLRQRGHVVLLHVDAIGRINVLYPLIPEDTFAIAAATPLAIDLPPTAQANPATLVAVWSKWPFDFSGMQLGSTWDYDALLLQPTAGRASHSRVPPYSRAGTALARGPFVQPDVCLGCVRHATEVAPAAAVPANAVDCSNSSMTNSFCGVNSGSVSINTPAPIVYQQDPAPVPAAVYVPYFIPMSRGFRRRFDEPSPQMRMPAPAPSQGVAYPIAPRLIVPSAAQVGTFRHR